MNEKKIKLEPAIIWKLVTCQRITSKKILDLYGSTPEPAIRPSDTGQRIPFFHSCQLITTLMSNGCVHDQFSCALKLARKNEIKHWSRSSKTTGQRTASKQITSPWWVDTWALDMAMWYWSVAILFWQLSIDHIVNGQCKRCGFAKTRLRHPSLPFDSLPYPTRTICRRVRMYARSVTWQQNEKRLTIFYDYGALSHARFAREGAPLLHVFQGSISE